MSAFLAASRTSQISRLPDPAFPIDVNAIDGSRAASAVKSCVIFAYEVTAVDACAPVDQARKNSAIHRHRVLCR